MNWTNWVMTHKRIEVGALAAVLFILLVFLLWRRRRPRQLDAVYFAGRWKELQKLYKDKASWPQAIIEADKLLDEALKQRKFKGKTMGERLVSAQRSLSSNDSVWFGHKLRNKLVHEEYKVTQKTEVRDALLGYFQALKDLGAIRTNGEGGNDK